MANTKLFLGKANYDFGTRYILLHVDSAVCINFNNPVGLGNYLFESYGRNFHRRISYSFPSDDEVANINAIREEGRLDKIVLTTLKTEEAKIIDDAVDKIDY